MRPATSNVLLAILISTCVETGCKRKNPLYCDPMTPCEPGWYCDIDGETVESGGIGNQCVFIPDAGTPDAGVDAGGRDDARARDDADVRDDANTDGATDSGDRLDARIDATAEPLDAAMDAAIDAGQTADAGVVDGNGNDATTTDASVLSANARLASLEIPGQTLTPAFSPGEWTYAADVLAVYDLATVIAVTEDRDATLTINGQPVASGDESPPIVLATSARRINVVVTAPAGNVVTYTVLVLLRDEFAHYAYIKASNVDAGDLFGSAVALSGDLMAVGAPHEGSNAVGVDGDESNNDAPTTGAVYVFKWDGRRWNKDAYLKAADPTQQAGFGRTVALSGDTLVVGAPDEANHSGGAYVFRRALTGRWHQEQHLRGANTEANDFFGASVALRGNTLAIGARGESSAARGVNGNATDNSATLSGAVYLFVRAGTVWTQRFYVKASNASTRSQFGRSLSLGDNILAVGAPFESSGMSGINATPNGSVSSMSGAAYMFRFNGSTWVEEAFIKSPFPTELDGFGTDVAVSNESVAVGVVLEDSASPSDGADDTLRDAGAVYVYRRNASVWTKEAYLKASNPGEQDAFGASVALSGDWLVCGASLEDGSSNRIDGPMDNAAGSSGAAYLYHRSAGIWSFVSYLKSPNIDAMDHLGDRVAISDRAIAIGAPAEDAASASDMTDNSAESAGAVYMIALPQNP